MTSGQRLNPGLPELRHLQESAPKSSHHDCHPLDYDDLDEWKSFSDCSSTFPHSISSFCPLDLQSLKSPMTRPCHAIYELTNGLILCVSQSQSSWAAALHVWDVSAAQSHLMRWWVSDQVPQKPDDGHPSQWWSKAGHGRPQQKIVISQKSLEKWDGK